MMKPYDVIDLGDGVQGVVLDALSAGPRAHLVEVFLAPGSRGDGVMMVQEAGNGGFIIFDPDALALIKRQIPNI